MAASQNAFEQADEFVEEQAVQLFEQPAAAAGEIGEEQAGQPGWAPLAQAAQPVVAAQPDEEPVELSEKELLRQLVQLSEQQLV